MNVNVEINRSDNAEDKSLECTRITINLTSREVDRLNEIRGGDSIIAYIKRIMNVERPPEEVEQMLRDQDRPFELVGTR